MLVGLPSSPIYGLLILSRVFDPPDEHSIQRGVRSIGGTGRRSKDQTFGFDRVFDENTSQAEVYEATTKNLLDSVLDGYNATVFAYGATGCGKTHTITGTIQQPGVIFMTMQELFERITERSEEKHTDISLSYLEIYNETIRDLLVPGGSKQALMLREDANQAVSVAGLSSHQPQNVQEVMDMIVRGNEYRTMSPTEANATSSRSHAVLQINVSQKDRNASIDEPHTMATLSIIDLAGSERASATKNRGERLQEGANINKSLLALGSCINALCDPRKRNHVPYRNSKLTRLLKFSLGGNCKTVMIVCVSPSSQHFDETQNTLRYANRAKNIQTKVTRNVYNVNRHVKDFLVKIDEQMALINELKQQQKDHEAIAFVKFNKQQDKREAITRECTMRIRNAYQHSETERLEKTSYMRKLRQVERRISLISSWIAAFDQVSDNAEQEEALVNCQAMRKTAQGMLLELESSRHHFHQKIIKSHWERAIDSALQNGIKQLTETDAKSDGQEIACLTREAELLKGGAEREALTTIAADDKGGDASMIQTLLQSNFETITAIQNIMSLTEEEAMQTAKAILGNMVKSCIRVTSHIIKPDGSLMPTEAFPPTRSGTPKRKKQVALSGPSPMKLPMPVSVVGVQSLASPVRLSPKRRKVPGSAKKGISFTPKKKSPAKGMKRGVRWRDDMEDGTLAEFEQTPQRVNLTPASSGEDSTLQLPPQITSSNSIVIAEDPEDSSPLPIPPTTSHDSRPKNNRFKAGFLAKKSDGSPLPPTLSQLSSDSDHSPLREIEPGKAANRSSLQHIETITEDISPPSSGNNSGSDADEKWKSASKVNALKINRAAKRASIAGGPTSAHMHRQRRKSPMMSATGSPPSENSLFTASQARRMVKSDKENEWRAGILSPRTAPVVKHPAHRRTTMGGDRPRDSSSMGRDAARLSGAITPISGHVRGSLSVGHKAVWR